MTLITTTSSEKRCAVVTGGSKGIGLEICRKLAANGVFVILTARNEKNGTEAVEALKVAGLSDVIFHQLDIQDTASIAALAVFVQTNFRKLDILVNNAVHPGWNIVNPQAFKSFKGGAGFLKLTDEDAPSLKGIIEQDSKMAEDCLRTNYYGTKAVTVELLPLLQLSSSARIVNVSSFLGGLQWIHNEKVREELGAIENLTEERLDEIVEWFLKDFKEDKLEANGWPTTLSGYKMSKITINAYTRLLARKLPNMLVNCVHPGYVQTDLTSDTGPMISEEGARAPTMVALLPDDGPSGLFFYEMQPSNFYDGPREIPQIV